MNLHCYHREQDILLVFYFCVFDGQDDRNHQLDRQLQHQYSRCINDDHLYNTLFSGICPSDVYYDECIVDLPSIVQ